MTTRSNMSDATCVKQTVTLRLLTAVLHSFGKGKQVRNPADISDYIL